MIPMTQGEARLNKELDELRGLAEASEWIQQPSISKNSDGLLVWSFVMSIGGRLIPLRLVFPALFPELPPFVLPEGDSIRLSQHQYGEGGELCLQYRPDNWHPDCKSTDVVRSAHALLRATPEGTPYSDVDDDHPQDLPSRLMAAPLRFIIPAKTARLLRNQLAGHVVELDFTYELRSGVREVVVARVAKLKRRAGSELPSDGPGTAGNLTAGFLYRLPGICDLPNVSAQELGEIAYRILPLWLQNSIAKNGNTLIVVSNGEREVLLHITGEGSDQKVESFQTVNPPKATERRVHGKAFQKFSVCIIGAGSLGSKVATTLTREGVGNFMLLDNDVLWSDNLVRNDLDEMDVGHHKADALKHRLQRIMPTVNVAALQMSLTSQSSVQTMAQLNEIIGSCDLVIDTTADSGVFRAAAAVCTQKLKPLVWGRIYAGGIGGLIARSVPNEDPPPMVAASQLRAWCDAKGQLPPEGLGRNYGLETDDMEEPLFASDSDVAVIANRLVRHALDSLLGANARAHPEPAYFIGLRRGWIFDHPFDIHPVAYTADEDWGNSSTICDKEGLDRILMKLGVQSDTSA